MIKKTKEVLKPPFFIPLAQFCLEAVVAAVKRAIEEAHVIVLHVPVLVDNDCEAVFAGKKGKILKKSLWVDPAGQKPNTLNPDLVK